MHIYTLPNVQDWLLKVLISQKGILSDQINLISIMILLIKKFDISSCIKLEMGVHLGRQPSIYILDI